MINIALYQPDIPQNTAAIIRLAAGFNLKVYIIEPCCFNINDSRFRRVVMDYDKFVKVIRYSNFESFKKLNLKSRLILMTTRAKKIYYKFKFKKKDILLFGRESAGVPSSIHVEIKNKLKVPINQKTRSLNVAMTVAIVTSEIIKQNIL